MKNLLGIGFLFIMILSACAHLSDIDFVQNYKDFVYYAPGSYWIYRDSANQSIQDSVTVITNIYGTVNSGGGKPSPKHQTLTTRYYSTKDSIHVLAGFVGQDDEYGDFETPYGDDGSIDTATTINYYFHYPFDPKNAYISGIDSLKINNKTYKDVVGFNNSYGKSKSIDFWSKHYGVIKSVSHGITWQLDTCVVRQ